MVAGRSQEELSMNKSRILSAVATTVAAAGLSSAAYGQAAINNPDGDRVKNVVLVHGAFADGSGWRGVRDELASRGYRVTIVQNPLTSLADDVAATRRVLDRLEGPAVLVGHSWGGTVITEAGVHPRVASLVYVAALSPDAGESTAQQYAGFPPATEFPIETQPDGFGFIKPEHFKAAFAADSSDADADFLRDSQVPINMAVFATKLANAAWKTKPSWAVFGTEDKAFGAGMLQAMARRIGARTSELRGSHAIFTTQARAVANVIDEAARHGTDARTHDSESNKQVVLDGYAALLSGDVASYLAGMTDDVTITYFGDHLFTGTYRGKADIIQNYVPLLLARLDGPIKITVTNAIAEGDQVFVEARGESRTRDGQSYNNLYGIILKLRRGKIAEIREYMDTDLVKRIFGGRTEKSPK
jgi:ketosteroid isomerase-like protein/pimeloyl-ACP methyl ester carboxylesterase